MKPDDEDWRTEAFYYHVEVMFLRLSLVFLAIAALGVVVRQ